MNNGLILEDGDAEDEIDVTIGKELTSLTTVAGKLAVSGDTVIKNGTAAGGAKTWSQHHFSVDGITNNPTNPEPIFKILVPNGNHHAVVHVRTAIMMNGGLMTKFKQDIIAIVRKTGQNAYVNVDSPVDAAVQAHTSSADGYVIYKASGGSATTVALGAGTEGASGTDENEVIYKIKPVANTGSATSHVACQVELFNYTASGCTAVAIS